MTQIVLKRVYEDYNESDGFRVLVDRLWPRGIKKEYLHYDEWAKDITPSSELRKWFHENKEGRWDVFVSRYREELKNSKSIAEFLLLIEGKPRVTLLYASKNEKQNHAIILKEFLDDNMKNKK